MLIYFSSNATLSVSLKANTLCGQLIVYLKTAARVSQSDENTGGSIISKCRLGKWSWTGTLDCFNKPFTSCNLSKQCRPWLGAYCTVCQCPGPDFTNNPLFAALWRHRDKNIAVINNRYLDCVQTRGLMSLVNDNHMEITVYGYYGSITTTFFLHTLYIVFILQTLVLHHVNLAVTSENVHSDIKTCARPKFPHVDIDCADGQTDLSFRIMALSITTCYSENWM